MATVTLPEYKSTTCTVCGHPSHCSGPLYLDVKDYQCDNPDPYHQRQIKACHQCSCKLCKAKN